MQEPSDNWKLIRRATLARARRAAVDPLSLLYNIHLAACVLYLAGFLQIQIIDYGSSFNVFSASIIVGVAITGALVLVLTGSVLTLHFSETRLHALEDERSNTL